MYVPVYHALDDEREVRSLVAATGAAELFTVKPDGYPTSTLLPVIWDDGRLVFHMARANPHWRLLGPATPALAVVTGPQAYVSAAWYPSKQEHGRVVPTWNYSAVHFTGTVTVHHDPEWLRSAVSRLTHQNEDRRSDPWHVTDAPATYVEKQLRAIVGLELVIERVEGKAKLSQNRSAADHSGVIAGLRREGDGRDSAVAAAMERTGIRS
jgi:transcriptional regulator